MSSLEPVAAISSFVVPVPRTAAVAEVWAEFASVMGIGQEEADQVIKQGIHHFLIERANFLFLNAEGSVALEIVLRMDWKSHNLLVEQRSNIHLDTQRPFAVQLHDGFSEVFTFVHAIKRREGLTRTVLTVRYRDEIYADPTLVKNADKLLGVTDAKAFRYVRGEQQRDLQCRFAALPETSIVIRERWS